MEVHRLYHAAGQQEIEQAQVGQQLQPAVVGYQIETPHLPTPEQRPYLVSVVD